MKLWLSGLAGLGFLVLLVWLANLGSSPRPQPPTAPPATPSTVPTQGAATVPGTPPVAAAPTLPPTATPAAPRVLATPSGVAPTPGITRFTVANTDGEGVYLRRTPHWDDKTAALWHDDSVMEAIGARVEDADHHIWIPVRTPDGTPGWLPLQYLQPATPPIQDAGHAAAAEPTAPPHAPADTPPDFYADTGAGQSKTWTLTLAPGSVLIVGGFKVDGVSGGVYKAVSGGRTVTLAVTDGFVITRPAERAREEFCARVQEATQQDWAHHTVRPLDGWPPC